MWSMCALPQRSSPSSSDELMRIEQQHKARNWPKSNLFTKQKTTAVVVSKLEEIVAAEKFKLRKTLGILKLYSLTEGRKGKLEIRANISDEVAPELLVMEMKKASGSRTLSGSASITPCVGAVAADTRSRVATTTSSETWIAIDSNYLRPML